MDVVGPRELKELLILEEAEDHRHICCTSYEDCLDLAIAASWTSWSCNGCPKWEQDVAKRGMA